MGETAQIDPNTIDENGLGTAADGTQAAPTPAAANPSPQTITTPKGGTPAATTPADPAKAAADAAAKKAQEEKAAAMKKSVMDSPAFKQMTEGMDDKQINDMAGKVVNFAGSIKMLAGILDRFMPGVGAKVMSLANPIFENFGLNIDQNGPQIVPPKQNMSAASMIKTLEGINPDQFQAAMSGMFSGNPTPDKIADRIVSAASNLGITDPKMQDQIREAVQKAGAEGRLKPENIEDLRQDMLGRLKAMETKPAAPATAEAPAAPAVATADAKSLEAATTKIYESTNAYLEAVRARRLENPDPSTTLTGQKTFEMAVKGPVPGVDPAPDLGLGNTFDQTRKLGAPAPGQGQ
jgi:hypothetical protein